VYLSTRVAIPTLSNGTDTFTVFFGLSTSSIAVGTDAVLIQYDTSIDATHWVFTSRIASVNNNVISAITVTAGQLYVLEVIKLAGSTTWSFYIDGVLAGTVAGVGTTAMCGVDYIIKSAGVNARTKNVDWTDIELVEPGKRAAGFLA
jgi:hypothetical protein